MISFDEALNIVFKRPFKLKTEKVGLDNCLNRVLAIDAVSDINMPPFDKSAVDGFACRSEDVDKELIIIETVQAGQMSDKRVNPGECVQIMTGAPIPEGADKIVMVEHCEVAGNKVKILKNQLKSNICKLAEDVKSGEIVLAKNTLLKPGHVAILASAGYAEVPVFCKPSVGIISTGDELVEPSQIPDKSQIRNSNGPQLKAQAKNLGIEAAYYGIAPDTKEDTYKIVQKSMSENDITLLTGGVSMGKYDFVPEVIEKIGVKILFSQLAIKPGKPTVFGVLKDKFIFGLPGNPVSSFVLFEIMVKPLIFRFMGHNYESLQIKLPIGIDYLRQRTGRQSFIPVVIKDNQIFPVEYHGSAHINSLSLAHGLISIPSGISEIKKGELIDVRQI